MIYDLLTERLIGEEVILLELTEDLPQEIKNDLDWKPFMKKGWKTWTSADLYEGMDDVLIIEDNYYGINYPSSLFKIIE